MNCNKCKRKISRVGYKWLGKIWCWRCFEKERARLSNDFNVEWIYELIDVKELEAKSQRKLFDFGR